MAQSLFQLENLTPQTLTLVKVGESTNRYLSHELTEDLLTVFFTSEEDGQEHIYQLNITGPEGTKTVTFPLTCGTEEEPAKAPEALDDTQTVGFNQETVIPILDNDRLGNSPASVTTVTVPTIVTQPLHGTVTVESDGTLRYKPTKDYSGPDSLIYQICNREDLTLCDQATVGLTVDTPPNAIGSAAINVIFNTQDSASNYSLILDYRMRVKLITPGLSLTDQEVVPSTDPTIRFRGGTTVDTAVLLASPYKSNRNTNVIGQWQKYYSFAFSLNRFRLLYPQATQLQFDVLAQPIQDPVRQVFDQADRYRIMRVNFSTHRTLGIVSQPLNDATGLDYDYNGPLRDNYFKDFKGDGVQGVVIPTTQETLLGRVTLDLVANTASFVELIDVTP